jgi:hypothetical protein
MGLSGQVKKALEYRQGYGEGASTDQAESSSAQITIY